MPRARFVFLTAKGCSTLEEEDIKRVGGAAAAGFLDEKGVNQCTSLGQGFTYTWFCFPAAATFEQGLVPICTQGPFHIISMSLGEV